jgi:hypothetical protein
MPHVIVMACRVQPERMKEFLGLIQQWEHAIDGVERPPAHQSIYVNEADPSRVLLITHFESAGHAEEFRATGLLDEFTERVLSCTAGEPGWEAYDLYYDVGPGGPTVIFGETTR